jgi:hypothetical protein
MRKNPRHPACNSSRPQARRGSPRLRWSRARPHQHLPQHTRRLNCGGAQPRVDRPVRHASRHRRPPSRASASTLFWTEADVRIAVSARATERERGGGAGVRSPVLRCGLGGLWFAAFSEIGCDRCDQACGVPPSAPACAADVPLQLTSACQRVDRVRLNQPPFSEKRPTRRRPTARRARATQRRKTGAGRRSERRRGQPR